MASAGCRTGPSGQAAPQAPTLNCTPRAHRLSYLRMPAGQFSTRSGTYPPSMWSTERRPFPHRRGLIIVSTLATAYVASHFFRASNVTIGLDLMRDLAIGPEALGALTGAFFFGFAAMQIPCGFFFDHFGPRRSVAGMLILATIGGIIFTLAPSWPILLTGRVLMGAGFGVMLIGTMGVISRWFPPDRFSTLAAMVMSIGLLGNLAATTPLAWASQAIGWRSGFGARLVLPPPAAHAR